MLKKGGLFSRKGKAASHHLTTREDGLRRAFLVRLSKQGPTGSGRKELKVPPRTAKTEIKQNWQKLKQSTRGGELKMVARPADGGRRNWSWERSDRQ